ELADLFAKHKVMPPGALGYQSAEYLQLYETNRLAILGAGSSNYATIQREAPAVFEQTALMLLPTGPQGGAVWISPDGIGIFAASKHKDEAEKFIEFYL